MRLGYDIMGVSVFIAGLVFRTYLGTINVDFGARLRMR